MRHKVVAHNVIIRQVTIKLFTGYSNQIVSGRLSRPYAYLK